MNEDRPYPSRQQPPAPPPLCGEDGEKRPLIKLNRITAAYGTKTVLQDVSLTIEENDFLGVTGPNGGGKTTLLKVILGLLKPSGGSISRYENGKPAASLKTGYLPQINRIDRHFPISVCEVIASGLMSERETRWNRSDQRRRISDVISRMGLDHLAKRPIGELSGGELQRVLFGRSIVSQPKILILDEPDTHIDKQFESRMRELLREINRDTAVILVSHDMGMMLPLVKNIARVNGTLHYHSGNDLTNQWIEDVYGKI
jgi:zinc transport system ATP-binding protein